jgi:hypothetical protein
MNVLLSKIVSLLLEQKKYGDIIQRSLDVTLLKVLPKINISLRKMKSV